MSDAAAPALPPVELLICTKCRVMDTDPDGDTRPGTQLLDALNARDLPAGVSVRGVECLSNCTRGCSVALRGRGRWSYVYGNLPQDAADLVLDGAARYYNTADGLVPWRERSDHFRKNCIARIPPLES